MAVIPILIERVTKVVSSSSTYRPSYRVPVEGISVGVILGVMFLLFVGSLIYQYYYANRKFKETGKPIQHWKILGNALLFAIFIGVIIALVNMCTGGGQGASSNERGTREETAPMQQQESAEYMGASGGGSGGYYPMPAPPTPVSSGGGPNFWDPLKPSGVQ